MSIQRIVVVLGMHRSGTSAITRGLQALSVDLGDNLMPPISGNNEKGFWEDVDFNAFNERLLKKSGSAWAKLSPLESSEFWKGGFATERYDAASMIESKLGDSPIFGLKDPRTALLLPFWKCVFEDLGLDENYLIALRNPLEVAESLRKRNNFSHPYGMVLWAKHNWAAVTGSEGKKRLCVSYRTLLDDPVGQLARIAEAFDLPVPAPASKNFIEFAGDFLSQDMRHNRISDKELARAANVPEIVPPLYEMLREWADAPPSAEGVVPAELKAQIESFWNVSSPLLAVGDNLKAVGDAASVRAASIEKERVQIASELDQSKSVIAENSKALEEARATIAATESLLDEAKSRIASLTTDMADLSATLASRDECILALQTAVEGAQGEKQLLEVRLEALTQDVATRDAHLDELETAVTSAQEQKQLLEAHLEALTRDVATRDAHLDELETAVTSAQEQKQLLEAHLEALTQDVATRDAHLAELETAVTSAQEQKRRMEVRLEALAQDVATRDAQLAEEKAAGRQQVADTAARLEQSIAQTEALQIELVEKTKDIRLLRHQMLERQSAEAESQKQLRNQFDQKSQELRQQLASTERRLKEAEATASRHLEQLSRNNAAVDGANARIRALESTLTEQQAILSDRTTTIRLLRHEVHTLRSSTSWKVSKPLRIVKVVLTHPRRVLNRLLGLNNQSSRSE